MTKEEIDKYRDKIEEQIKDRDNSIHTMLTYVTAGALGLFLTINQDFFHLAVAKYAWLMGLSLCLLLLALLLNITISFVGKSANETIRDFIDNQLTPNDKNGENESYRLWQNEDKKLSRIQIAALVFMIIGIVIQIIFISFNIKTENSLEKNEKNQINNIYLNIDSNFNKGQWKQKVVIGDTASNVYLWTVEKK